MHYLRSSLILLFLYTSAATTARDVALQYAPDEGTVLKRTFRQVGDLQLERMIFVVDGEESEPEDVSDSSIHVAELIVVTDVIELMGEGRPLRLSRTFDELANTDTYSSGDMKGDVIETHVSDLQGLSVVAIWKDEVGEYTFEPAGEEKIDSDLLERLIEDMDFRLFLPEDECSEGDTWELPAEAWIGLVYPAGVMGFHEEGEEFEDFHVQMALAKIEGIEGKGKATLGGIRDEDDLQLAVITFDLTVSHYGEYDAEPETEGSTSAVVGIGATEEYEGVLLWDVEHGHAHSLTATAKLSIERILRSEGVEWESQVKEVYSGKVAHEVTMVRE